MFIPLPRETDITFDHDNPEASFEAATTACAEYDFAVLRGVVPLPCKSLVRDETIRFCDTNTKLAFHRYEAPDDMGYFVRIAPDTRFDSYALPNIIDLIGKVSSGLAKAALKNDVGRMNTGTDVKLDVLVGNRYPVGGHIDIHQDGNKGVVLSLSTHGIGLASLSSRGTDHNTARTFLKPFDLMVLPAEVGSYGGSGKQADHAVKNTTPICDENGIRRSITAVYSASGSSLVTP